MARNLVLCLSLLMGIYSSSTWAVGMGELDLDSALNERFSGEITLIDSSGLDSSEILVSLGSTDDFRRVGVERFFYLTDLKFEVSRNRNGSPVIKVTSGQPITEPYLNFLVEVLWPSGRMLKEFTVLLDPPTFSAALPAPVQTPATASTRESNAGRNAGQVERPSSRRSGTVVQLPTPQQAPEEVESQLPDGQIGLTGRNDTLWKIASRTRPNNRVTINQSMLAIQRLNPKAFIKNNINLLKAGYRLALPSEAQIAQLSVSAARAEVSLQNQDWQAYRNGEQIAARPSTATDTALKSPLDARDTVSPAASTPISEGQLKIVTGDEQGVGTTQSGESTIDVAALAASKEEGERLAREVEELSYQLDRQQEAVNNEIAVRDRQIEVKDQKIAQLENQLRLAREASQNLTTDNLNQNQSAAEPTPWWLTTTAIFAGGGVLILALIGGLIVARRRKADEEEFARAEQAYESEDTEAYADRHEPVLEFSEDEESDEDDATSEAGDDLESWQDDEEETAEYDTQEVLTVDAEEHQATRLQTTDVLGEADIYIAYGRYPQAIELLSGVLVNEPERAEVRLKLLELYVETNEREAFNEQLVGLVDNCDNDDILSQARDLEIQLSDSSVSGEFENLLDTDDVEFDATDLADSAATSRGENSLEETLENAATVDDFDLDLELESDTSDAEVLVDTETDLFELELDEENTSHSLTEIEQAIVSEDDFKDDLGGDLGIDFDPDNDPDTEVTESEATVEIKALPIDDDLAANGEDEDFEFDDAADGANTKLDLARAYIDMGDQDGARDILNEVLEEGNDEQQKQANNLLEEL